MNAGLRTWAVAYARLSWGAILLFLCGLSTTAPASAQTPPPAGVGTPEGWQPASATGYEYRSTGFSCRVLPDARVLELNLGGVRIADEIYLRGDGTTTSDAPERVLLQQRDAHAPGPLLYREHGGTVQFRTRLVLGSAKHPRVADCDVELHLSPLEIRVDCTATLAAALTTHGNVFITHIRLVEAAWVGRGARAEYQRAGPRLFVLPFQQTKAGVLNLGGLSTLRVGVGKDLLLLAAGEGSSMRLLDDPGWGGKFSVHVYPGYTWFAQAIEQPAGETCRWSVRLALTDAESESK